MSDELDVSVVLHYTREAAMQVLCDMMSDTSEECWCAGWMSNTEENLPEACREIVAGEGLGVWGMQPVNREDAFMMCAIADKLGHWVDMDGNPYVPECDK